MDKWRRGRTYWGGALFCAIADVRINHRASNRYGPQDALRVILAAGGKMKTSWPLERALIVGDTATGVSVLTEFYQLMKAKPVQCDLAGLWNKLGIESLGGVSFNDGAPLAAVRGACNHCHACRTDIVLSCVRLRSWPRAPRGRDGCLGFAELFDGPSEYLNGAFGGRPATS